MTTTNNLDEIAKNIVADNTKHGYEPVFFDRGYCDTHDEALSLFIAGDDRWREIAYDVLDDWFHSSVWNDARELVREDISNHGNMDIDEMELRQLVVDYLCDACTQDYALQWIMNMRNPVARVQVDGLSDPEFVSDGDSITPQDLLKQAGISESKHNVSAAQSIINEALSSCGGSYYNLFLVFELDLSDLKNGGGDTIRIFGEAELWATNVYQGDGWSETVEIDVTVPRKMLMTDNHASGYSYCDVFGTSAGYLPEATVKFV